MMRKNDYTLTGYENTKTTKDLKAVIDNIRLTEGADVADEVARKVAPLGDMDKMVYIAKNVRTCRVCGAFIPVGKRLCTGCILDAEYAIERQLEFDKIAIQAAELYGADYEYEEYARDCQDLRRGI